MSRNPFIRASLGLATVLLLCSVVQAQQTLSFSNTNPITIPFSGTASPYPSTIQVSGFENIGTINDITVSIFGLSHTSPFDFGALVTGPITGQKTVLFNGAGGSTSITDVDLAFNDSASATLSSSSPIVSGTYRPGHNDYPDDPFSAPAPALSYSTTFGPSGTPVGNVPFLGANNPNGTYSLFVEDFVGGDAGIIAEGWSITITFTPVPEPTSILLGAAGFGFVGTAIRRRWKAKRA